MARWEGGAPERLIAAAMELYAARGYEGTTVADIAARAGVTERTYFRHFADKREVLFRGADFVGAFLDGVRAAPAGATTSQLIDAALEGSTVFFPAERWEWARARHRVLEATPALREREMLKMADLVAALTAALTERGEGAGTAALAAEITAGVFRVAFTRWVAADEAGDIAAHVRRARAELDALLR